MIKSSGIVLAAGIFCLILTACEGLVSLESKATSRFKSLISQLEKISDVASAEGAVPELEKIIAGMEDIDKRLWADGKGAMSDFKLRFQNISEKLVQERMLPALEKISANPELAEILGPTLKKLDEVDYVDATIPAVWIGE